jgi:hypothetical protein
MAPIIRIKARWQGFTGSPGYSNFFFKDPAPGASWDQGSAAAADLVHAYFTGCKGQYPPNVQIQVAADAEIIEETTGELQNIANAGVKAVIVGGGPAGVYSAASGAVTTWRTGGVRNGRRVRGRTFHVPLIGVAYENDGSLGVNTLSSFNLAATNLINAAASQEFGVWSRPSAKGAADGIFHAVIAHTVPDKVAVLRSRRD